MRLPSILLLLVLMLTTGLVACGGGDAPAPEESPTESPADSP